MSKKWLGDPPFVDSFGDPITDEFIDGVTALTRQWAIMTPRSWRLNGIGKLGTGKGQRYRLQEDFLTWLKVED